MEMFLFYFVTVSNLLQFKRQLTEQICHASDHPLATWELVGCRWDRKTRWHGPEVRLMHPGTRAAGASSKRRSRNSGRSRGRKPRWPGAAGKARMTGPEAVGTSRLGRAETNSTSSLLKNKWTGWSKYTLSTYAKILTKRTLLKGPDSETYTFILFLTNCWREINWLFDGMCK